jgi:hypothetical protein
MIKFDPLGHVAAPPAENWCTAITIKLNTRLLLRHDLESIACPHRRSHQRGGVTPRPTPSSPASLADLKGRAMSDKKYGSTPQNEAGRAFRSRDNHGPLTEYEKEQRALHKNLERLRAERLAREAVKSKDSQN